MCEICKNKIATQKHHLFSQTKLNKKIYAEYIHNKDNIIFVCEECHLWKAIPKWTEYEFCKHFKIKPRSKSGIQKYNKIFDKTLYK